MLLAARVIFAAFILATAPAVRAQAWTSLADIPVGKLQEHITIALSSTKLATVGGLINNINIDHLLIYDIPSNSWARGTAMPLGLNHPSGLYYEGKIYILGGLTGGSNWPATPQSFVYDPTTDAWGSLSAMPTAVARGSAATAVHNGTIFLAGGIPSIVGRTVTTVSAYHVATDTWIDLPSAAARMPGARDHMAYAQVGSKFYVVAGRENGARNNKNDVFILDLADLDAGWTTSVAKMPTARGGLAAALLGTKIYTFGGEGNRAPNTRGVFNQTEVYDTATDSWESLPAMQLPRHGTSAVAIEGKIYIPGGGIVEGAGATESFDVFVP